MKATCLAALCFGLFMVAAGPVQARENDPLDPRVSPFTPERDVSYGGFDLQSFDVLLPEELMWLNGYQIEAQLGAWMMKYAAVGIGVGIGQMTPNRDLLFQQVIPLVPVKYVHLHTVAIEGTSVAVLLGPTLFAEVTPCDWLSIGVQAGIRYSYYALTPTVRGQKEREVFDEDDVEISVGGEDIKIQQINYTTDYEENIDFSPGMLWNIALQLELGKPGHMKGVIGVGRVYDLTESEVRFRGHKIDDVGMRGLLFRVAIRNSW
ncbi:MAG: hypothetical protein HQ559_04590 [Lentisphaerae bacterium]|nr:hypothetical protein [Lentisphaerota bacterium]